MEQCSEKHSQKCKRLAEVSALLVVQDPDTQVLSVVLHDA